ncbi:MAG: HAMP domain-containing protein, partial [Fusobacteriaceae bacterium]|nr:HAMP domain-containing protein [Fusobacteriaceae bacterium]
MGKSSLKAFIGIFLGSMLVVLATNFLGLIAGTICGIIIAVISGIFTVKPLGKLKNALKKAADGELSYRMDSNLAGELKEIAIYFNLFMDNLTDTINAAKFTGDEIRNLNLETKKELDNLVNGNRSEFAKELRNPMAEGIIHLRDYIQVTLDKVRNQTAATEESAATLEKINEGANKMKESLQESKNVSEDALMKAIGSMENVQMMIDKMNIISDSVNDAEEKVNSLLELSRNIGNITTAITTLADQTNLLALNAAIESARAGEAGRGFAVVSQEIKKLAEKTNQETSKIDEIIKSIQSEIENVKGANDKVQHNVVEGIEISMQVNSSIDEILLVTSQNNENIEKIGFEIQEQVIATEEIMTAVASISSASTEIEE